MGWAADLHLSLKHPNIDKYCQKIQMNSLGNIIRNHRKERKLPLREVATFLDMDQAILSKIERGQRNITREHIIKLADYYEVNQEVLLAAWLSDKIMYTIGEEESALKALQMAEEQVAYRTFQKTDRKAILTVIKDMLRNFSTIRRAWIYGSFSRGDDKPGSDIDMAIEADDSFSYFDLAEIQHQIEQAIQRKVDIGFIDAFKPHIRKNVETDLKLVYEKSTS
jgi:predicted nucleotidyltransferase/plasmid maintenance system antidote protein VapI